MTPMLSSWKTKLTNKQAELTLLSKQRDGLQRQYDDCKERQRISEEAHNAIQTAVQITQATLSEELGSVVSMALAAVFSKSPYKFLIKFPTRRNSVECDLLFERNGEEMRPLDDAGFGAADIASVAMRVSYQASGDTRALILIDEPCKNLSVDYLALGAAMFRRLCEELDMQMIIVTHIPEFREAANKLNLVAMRSNETSYIAKTV